MSKPHKTRSTESFYGRRKGQQLRGRKLRVMDELLPKLRFDVSTPLIGNLADTFAGPAAKTHLEIGFGGGEHLAHQASTHPDINFIGVEPFINGMAKILGRIEDDGLTNIRLYDDDATQLLDWLPAECLDQVDLLYPDPWPKKRHWKRRFVSQVNLERIWSKLKPGGRFRFASDIDTYINWTLQHIHQHGKFSWTAQAAPDWNEPWHDWVRTRYEAKAIRESRPPCYLVFEKL